jgi:hypothetical protein
VAEKELRLLFLAEELIEKLTNTNYLDSLSFSMSERKRKKTKVMDAAPSLEIRYVCNFRSTLWS